MGHDISGYLSTDKDDENEIAYLRRGAFNPLKNTIYEALQCQEHNCGVSGCGTDRVFTPEQLQAALARVPKGEDYEPERKFLRKCLDAEADVRIEFY